MQDKETTFDFEAQWERIRSATGARTFAELAAVLSIGQAEVSDVMRRGRIPVSWLHSLHREHGINSEWILSGSGRQRGCAGEEEGAAPAVREEADIVALLRKVPARLLAEELVRRAAGSGEK